MCDSVTRFCRLAAAVFFFLAAACGTSTGTQPLAVDLQLEQLPDAGFAVEDRGAVSIAYQMSMRNRRSGPSTLRKVELQVLSGGSYTLRNAPAALNETIEPAAEAMVTFTMWGHPRERRAETRKVMWVSGIAHFDSAEGNLRKEFTLSFREP